MLLVTFVCQTMAGENSSSNETQRLIKQISASDYWHKLLHYKSRLLTSGFQSDITDPSFFLADDGRENPESELRATIATFENSPDSICQFPARYYWLSNRYGSHLGLESGKLKNCSELQEWEQTLNPGSATLIFPAAYLNGPSSMFGHTLLRIEPADERANLPLITYAINYAANVTQSDNDVAFAFKGILGGYPGIMAIVPYHEKIKEYGEIENRDIWEYRLQLDREEIKQMLRHAWELKDLRSAYYFFDLNCSYLILNLIETAREGIDLTSRFRFKVIPIDTVRAVEEAGLIAKTDYRAASATQLEQRYELLTPEQQSLVRNILETKPDVSEIKSTSGIQRDFARILEVAFDALRYQALQTPAIRDKNAAYNLELLRARSQLLEKEIWPEITVPTFKPEEGHKSARFGLSYQYLETGDKDYNAIFLKVRPAYHDLLDPAQGFPPGAQINFLDFSLSYDTENHDADLQKVTIIDILSLTPDHDLFDSLSWRVDFSYQKQGILQNGINVLQVSPGFGKSAYLIDDILGYALLNSTLEYSPDYEEDYALGVGLQSGLLVMGVKNSAKLELKSSRLFSGQTDTRFTANLGIAHHIETNLSVRLTVEREKIYRSYINRYQLGLNWYF